MTEPDQFNDLEDRARAALSEGRTFTQFKGITYKIVKEGRRVQVFAVDSVETDVTQASGRPLALSAPTIRSEPSAGGPPDASTARGEGSGLSGEMGNRGSAVEGGSEEERGAIFIGKLCAHRESQKCKNLRRKFNIPEEPKPVTEAGGALVATTTRGPVVLIPDPCQGKDACYTWGNYRENSFLPFVKQMRENGQLGGLPGDQAEGSLFNPGALQAWEEAANLPRENQALAAGTASAMGLKLLSAALSQLRLTRVEMQELDPDMVASWSTWLSVPGIIILLVYMCVSIYQIKSYWRRRLLQTEEDKATRMFEHFLKLQQSYGRDRVQEMEGGPPGRPSSFRDPRYNARSLVREA